MAILVAAAVVVGKGLARVDDKGGENAEDLADEFETTPGVVKSTFIA